MTNYDDTNSSDATAVVQAERGHLFGIAYRLMGTVSDAEEAVQETFLRWARADVARIENPRGWLTTVLTRFCLDQLDLARRRREVYVGQWLPEPLVSDADLTSPDPAEQAALDESVSLAMLVVLETLSPAERAVFVLHDVFGLDFEEVGSMVGRSPAACRQLASRARRHVEERRPRFDPDAAQQRRVVAAFLQAGADGDVQGLLALLDPSVVWRTDGGGKVHSLPRPIVGADRVVRLLMGRQRFSPGYAARLISVNGGTGVLVTQNGEIRSVLGITVAGGVITEIDLVGNPDKLPRMEPGLHVSPSTPPSGGNGR